MIAKILNKKKNKIQQNKDSIAQYSLAIFLILVLVRLQLGT